MALQGRTTRVGTLIPILVPFTFKMQVWTFRYILYGGLNRHYLVPFLITDLKQNERNDKLKSRQISKYLKR